MSFKTKYFTPIKEDRDEETISYIVRTVILFNDDRSFVEDNLNGFLYEEIDNPLNDETLKSYLIRELNGSHFGENGDRIPKPFIYLDREFEPIGSIEARSLDELIASLKTKTENLRQKEMQESKTEGYIVCETKNLGYEEENKNGK